jgi:hypothetical protein
MKRSGIREAVASKRAFEAMLGPGLVLALVCFAWSQAACAQTAPKKYQDLYLELDSQLSAFERQLPARSSGTAPIRAATLLSANCHRGEFILSEAQREATLRELDALKALRAEGIVLEICYPLLTPAFRDPQPFIQYYSKLANEVRQRGMQLVVEHNSLLPAYASVDVRPYYRRLTKQRFGRERLAELKAILVALNPDYLTLVSEPRTHTAGLTLTVSDWRTYLQRSVDTLSEQLGSFSTLLGAGSGLWDDFDYIQAFATIKGLSYIDLHLYPLTAGGESNLERLLTWPDRIRAIAPGKRIIMSELWLYKTGLGERFNSVADPAVFARDVYSFWSPLDQKFLRVVSIAAREKGIELVAPFWSRYFFAYVDYNDPLTFNLRPSGLLNLASQRAYAAILKDRHTDTGLAFRRM